MTGLHCNGGEYVLGLFGGDNPVDEDRAMDPYDYVSGHDSNAALIQGTQVVAACEQERFDRIKHSNKAPMLAVRACLEMCKARIDEMSIIAVPILERKIDAQLESRCQRSDYWKQHWGAFRARAFLQKILRDAFHVDIDTRCLRFVHHHQAHASLAYYTSGYEDALIVTIDGIGDDVALRVTTVRGNRWDIVRSRGALQSLGYFYSEITQYLGFPFHDEFKVMGMSSYGDPERFRRHFRHFVHLLPEGDFLFDWRAMRRGKSMIPPRATGAYPGQIHMDFAAAGQALFEEVLFHVLSHFRKATGLERVCLAGGAALNCAFNGKLLRSGLFADVYVPPAAGDSGLSLGAALDCLHAGQRLDQPRKARMSHSYLGPPLAAHMACEHELELWSQFIHVKSFENITSEVAHLLADGALVGWMHGPSEYGPRAFGNRSILADPRPASNRDVINVRVKGREEFRPFAPAVAEEDVGLYFEVPTAHSEYPFMTFTFPVRSQYRALLGAVTHVDGSARVQTVSRHQNPRFWDLLQSFRDLTGIPILLNTSFNNSHEPIVETVADAITCFLTCDLDWLVIEKQLIAKKNPSIEVFMSLCPSRPVFTRLNHWSGGKGASGRSSKWSLWCERLGLKKAPLPAWQIRNSYNREFAQTISPQAYDVLLHADGCRTIGELFEETGLPKAGQGVLLREMKQLWDRRLVRLRPRFHNGKRPCQAFSC